MLLVFFEVYGDHRDLHVLTHSFPTRRSSDLCFQCPLRECEGLRPLSDEQLEFTWSLKSCELHLERGGDILVQGSISPHLYTLLRRSEEHTSELQSLMRISYAVFCLKKKNQNINTTIDQTRGTTTPNI